MRAPSARDVAAGEVLLSVERVSLAFGGVRALVEVSFDIRKGEIRAIIGPNGAGKTSMLNVINGFYQPQDGQIIFRGEARRKMRPYEAASGGIARTFQNVALFKGMTALDNIMAGAQIRRFLVLHKELDADDGELTRTQKVRRGFIAERYAPLVQALYDASEQADIATEVTFEDGRKGVIKARVKIHDMKTVPVSSAMEKAA